MHKTIRAILLILIFNHIICFASDNSADIVIGEKVSIKSLELDEDREIWIYKPDGYDSNRKYNVIYLLDAETQFLSATGIVKYLAANEFIPDSIIVALPNTIRIRDFTPPISVAPQSRMQTFINSKFPLSGGANRFISFLQNELIPYIDDRYSTLPNRMIIGHSNGGVLALHALVSIPDLFVNYIIISPSAWWSEEEIDQNINMLFKTKPDIKGNLYLTVGNEGGQILSNGLRITANLEMTAPDSFSWRFKQMENESHTSISVPSILNGLKKTFEEFHINNLDEIAKYSDIKEVDKFYNDLSKKYGYKVNIPASVIEQLAQKHLQFGKSEQAVVAFKFNIEQNPESAFAYKNLGDVYMAIAKYSLAKSAYQTAVILAKQQQSEHLGFFQDMLENAKGKM